MGNNIYSLFFISVTEGVICKIKMKTFGSVREIQAYTNLMENSLPITLSTSPHLLSVQVHIFRKMC